LGLRNRSASLKTRKTPETASDAVNGSLWLEKNENAIKLREATNSMLLNADIGLAIAALARLGSPSPQV
jgi:hypothetical protein